MATVLLVDDDIDIRLSMSVVLEGQGYETLVAENGVEAIKQLEGHTVDCVLLDIFMPEKDGYETIGEIRRHYPQTKIIAMSGYNERSFSPLDYAQSLGADLALTKPFSADELKVSLKKLL
ncbi:Response regulator [Candidatus Terasakiella magnetica]|uniref:Response regulator n=1 Tax=Candidatus Terasakiella magnetica TaxID=1867952 RepID=A0A1C3REY5_9PROT|nr:response regulator [Candidatus Terasakiella magnetica]SCA55853.1 Response regulator [Candidatus Terasakiella magnetica]